jgi:hypothetical protein
MLSIDKSSTTDGVFADENRRPTNDKEKHEKSETAISRIVACQEEATSANASASALILQTSVVPFCR